MNGAVLSSHKAYDAAESKKKKESCCTTKASYQESDHMAPFFPFHKISIFSS